MTQAITHLIEYHPYQLRNERCAIGLLVIFPDGQVRAHLCRNLRKVKAMHPATDLDELRDVVDKLALDLSEDRELLAIYLAGPVGGVVLNPRAGYITFATQDEYEASVSWALGYMAEPVAAKPKRDRLPTSRLYLEIKNVFATMGWMAQPSQGIQDHRILPRYQLSAEEGLSVDFALLNTCMHYLQTADFRSASNPTQRRHEVQAKWFALTLAAQLTPAEISGSGVERYVVIAGGDTEEGAKAIKAVHRVTDHVFVNESAQDMRDLMDIYADAMGQPPLPSFATH